MKNQIQIYFVVITLFLFFLISLDLLLNTTNWRSSISLEQQIVTIPYPLDLGLLGGPLLQLKNYWKYIGFILTESYLSITIYIFIPTRLYLPSRV